MGWNAIMYTLLKNNYNQGELGVVECHALDLDIFQQCYNNAAFTWIYEILVYKYERYPRKGRRPCFFGLQKPKTWPPTFCIPLYVVHMHV